MECPLCHKNYNPDSEYLGHCYESWCNLELCKNCLVECVTCNSNFCPEHRTKCNGCTRVTCYEHVTSYCHNCG